LLPTESDARDYVVSDIEPIFAASPTLRGTLTEDGERNTLLSRRFTGGSLKIVAAKAPRTLPDAFFANAGLGGGATRTRGWSACCALACGTTPLRCGCD
jgi:hypothetical protein